MAKRVFYCPHCNTEAEVVKKGKVGELQRLLCKNCGRTFYVEVDEDGTFFNPRPTKNADPVAIPATATPETEVETEVITEIRVNGSLIKEIEGEISENEARELISEYFDEEGQLEKYEEDGRVIYDFKVAVGTKG